ncbi:MAG: hypothetical protein EP338_07290 [Bacteroidetes bacterium]|nr:MAG: hypothetical protein EP338_07290 [Bacteroidota bacterium]
MMDERDDIDRLFRESFEQHEVSPPPEVKDRIDGGIRFNQSRNGFFSSWIIWSFMGLLILGTAIIWWTRPDEKSPAQKLAGTHIQSQSEISNHSQKAPVSGNKLNKNTNLLSQSTDQKKDKTNTEINNDGHNNDLQTYEKRNSEKTALQNQIKADEGKKPLKTSEKKPRKSKKQKDTESNIEDSDHKKSTQTDSGDKLVDNDLKNPDGNQEKKQAESNKESADPDEEAKKLLGQTDPTPNADKGSKTDSLNHPSDSLNQVEQKPPKEAQNDPLLSDSTFQANNSDADQKKEQNKSKAPLPIMLSLQGGSFTSFNSFSDGQIQEKEQQPFHWGIEASYFFTPRLGLHSGIDHYRSLHELSKRESSSKQVQTGTSWETFLVDTFEIIQNDTVLDTMFYTYTDSTEVPTYQTIQIDSNKTVHYTTNSFDIPFLFHFNQKINERIYWDLIAGGALRFRQLKIAQQSGDDPTLFESIQQQKVGLKLHLRNEFRYQWTHFGVGIHGGVVYDLSPPTLMENKQKRWLLNYGVGLHYRL